MEDSEEDEEEEDETPQAGPSRLPAQPAPVVSAFAPEEGEASSTSDEPAVDPTALPPPPTLPPGPPPRIMITTSPSPCKDTYAFCEDLKGIFPGGEFFKRPKGKGFEIGRVARWAAKRGFKAVCVVNEDHKIASESLSCLRLGRVGVRAHG
jgi:ribosome production factor 1